jgi:hypothetical protein
MAKAKTVPMETDAETALQMTLNIFRDRIIGGKPFTDRDLATLEKSMRAYGELCVREHKGAGIPVNTV